MLETLPTATVLDLISYLKSSAYARMRRFTPNRGVYFLLIALLGLLSAARACGVWSVTPEGEGFAYAIRYHIALTKTLGLELSCPPTDFSFRFSFSRWTWLLRTLPIAT